MNVIEVFDNEETARDRNAKASMQKTEAVKVSDVYYLEGSFSDEDLKTISKLFVNELVQNYKTGIAKKEGAWIIEVRYKDSVSDPAEDSIRKALHDMGKPSNSVRTAHRYYVEGLFEESDIKSMCSGLANKMVEECYYGFEELDAKEPKAASGKANQEINEVNIREADEKELLKISKEGMLSLSIEEMKFIQNYFEKIGRNPTDGEIETLAQTWSEHCKHKTFNSKIELDNNGTVENFENMFKETIVAATSKIADKKDWLVSVFKDNAGIIKIDEKNNFAFKVETHNHPSALDPYGGASTGIGGCIRDILGAGLGAKPIFNTDVFCFAPPDYDKELPEGVLHPKRVFRGVVEGVRDYGNRMGIPTVNGAIIYDDDYLGAPLVYCGTGGIIPKGMENKKAGDGELIVVLGGRTGRDGLHGATFSSEVLDEHSSSSAVQIGNPIEEKKVTDALLKARDKRLYTSITDCGAGGFSSAVGEMAEETGAEVELKDVLLKHSGMQPWEIWMSESQERMVLAVPKENLEDLRKICFMEDITATVIGKFTDTKKLIVKYEDKLLVELDMEFLHHGLPNTQRKAIWKEKELEEPKFAEKDNYNDELKKILAHPSVASKEEVIRRYDHEVQGNTIGKPMVGVDNDGPSDAAVIRAEFGKKAIVVANGINPRYGLISSYWMAASNIDEALRNIVATGGDIGTTALLDNFCWGSTQSEEKLGSLVMAAKACHDIAIAFETPFISGKDSLHNEFRFDDKTITVPDTLLISAASIIDVENAISMDLKENESSVYIVGKTYDELAGSHFYNLIGQTGKNVPKARPQATNTLEPPPKAMRANLVQSCHDCSEGGIAVAAAEMAFAGNLGMVIDAGRIPSSTTIASKLLFSESNSRFLVEVRKENEKEFEKLTGATKIGETTEECVLSISREGELLIDATLEELKEAWKGTIKW